METVYENMIEDLPITIIHANSIRFNWKRAVNYDGGRNFPMVISPMIIDCFQVDAEESSRHCSVHQWRCIITLHEMRLSILKGRYPTFNRLDYRFAQSRMTVMPFKYSFTHTHTHTHTQTQT